MNNPILDLAREQMKEDGKRLDKALENLKIKLSLALEAFEEEGEHAKNRPENNVEYHS